MVLRFLLFSLLASCSSLRNQPDVLEAPIYDTQPRRYEPTPVYREPPKKQPSSEKVSWRQWQCCKDLCQNKVASVAKEFETKYIVCECRSGKKFRVAKIKEAKR